MSKYPPSWSCKFPLSFPSSVCHHSFFLSFSVAVFPFSSEFTDCFNWPSLVTDLYIPSAMIRGSARVKISDEIGDNLFSSAEETVKKRTWLLITDLNFAEEPLKSNFFYNQIDYKKILRENLIIRLQEDLKNELPSTTNKIN